MRSARLSIVLVCFAGLGALSSVAAATPAEPFFPNAGDRRYDALDYHVELIYRPAGWIKASTTVTAVATAELDRFSLDFFGPGVRGVSIGGEPVAFERPKGKLRVHPVAPIPAGTRFEVEVRYLGKPPALVDPSGAKEGWIETDDGALALGEPQGTATWIPCNNLPADKASFSFDFIVRDYLKAVANGRLTEVRDLGKWKRFSWVEPDPMSPYLALLAIGRGKLVKGRVMGLPSWTFVDPRMEEPSRRALAALPEIVRFQSRAFGAYPFGAVGSVVDYAPRLGYALETQARPIYTEPPDRLLVAHETAHQWFGNSVGPERWPEIWLNEGFATWAEWHYAERHGGPSAAKIFRRLYRLPASERELWNPPPGRPGTPANLFATSVYVRGAMTLQALRQKVGTKTMLRVLRTWALAHRHGSAGTREFIAHAEAVTGRRLDRFFQRWLYQRGKP
ncbi:MAG: M1 family metallopeptidase [Actinomycetota bacterium]|nr:M1 family metallopeptidase [Actinomycetota bacterium]